MTEERQLRRAVVIGGSMGGLLAARALSNHFDEVLILERDPVHGQTLFPTS